MIYRVSAWLLLGLMVDTGVGLQWDISWHRIIGRDTFWSWPHLLIYSGVALGGLVCCAILARDRRRAPLGFLVAGSGFAALLAAAPLDDLWHRLYGVDVALWSPFHAMGLTGGTIVIVGLLDLFAELGARSRAAGGGGRSWRFGLLFVLSGLLFHLMTVASPAVVTAPTADLGELQILLYPVLIAASAALVTGTASRAVPGRWSATTVAAFLLARTLIVGSLVPGAIAAGAAFEGLTYRTRPPAFEEGLLLMTLAMTVAAVSHDVIARGRGRWIDAALAGGIAAFLAALYVAYVDRTLSPLDIPPEFVLPAPPRGISFLIAGATAIPVSLVVAAITARIANGWGTLLRVAAH